MTDNVTFLIEAAQKKRTCHSCGMKILKGENHMVVVVRKRKINMCTACLTNVNETINTAILPGTVCINIK